MIMNINQMKKIYFGTKVLIVGNVLAVAIGVFLIGYLLFTGQSAVGTTNMTSVITVLALNLGFLFYGVECARDQIAELSEKGG